MTRTRLKYLAVAALFSGGIPAAAQPAAGVSGSAATLAAKPSIVLVHGAFADGTGWSDVIRILQKEGYDVTAVQNQLRSYAEDVETTKRLIDAQTGPVVVVGHSYGGAVITGATAGNRNVTALVYIAAFGPDAGEPIGAYLDKYPTALGASLRPDAAGFAYIDRAAFHTMFAQDLSKVDAAVAAAAQKPAHGSLFTAAPRVAAWRTIPSWYVVAEEDRAIDPELQRFYAKRMGATTREIRASHLVFISHPKAVANVIRAAATTAPPAAGR